MAGAAAGDEQEIVGHEMVNPDLSAMAVDTSQKPAT